MSFDTTSSNTGSLLDACTILQQKLGHSLYFVCRYHIWELVAETAFTCFGPSAGPDIQAFQTGWNSIDQSKFEPMMPGDLDSVVWCIL